MAELFSVDGSISSLSPANGRVFTLKELQTVVGGYIEVVRFNNNTALVIDEDGKLKGLLLNALATIAARNRGWRAGDVIVGPALLVDIVDTDEGKKFV